MKVTIVIDSAASQSGDGIARHQAKVYPAVENPAEPIMVTGWNANEDAVRQHAFQWAQLHGHEIDAPVLFAT